MPDYAFICASCLEEFTLSKEVFEYLSSTPEHGQTRCTNCGSTGIAPAESLHGTRIQLAKDLKPALEELEERLKGLADAIRSVNDSSDDDQDRIPRRTYDTGNFSVTVYEREEDVLHRYDLVCEHCGLIQFADHATHAKRRSLRHLERDHGCTVEDLR